MLDVQVLGRMIASLRKQSGYSQERLANMLRISPQAISKWENGHSSPDTSLLPVLAQIFGCTIDDIIMPAYMFDEKIEQEKSNAEELQAERIASQIMIKLEGRQMAKTIVGMDDEAVTNAIRDMYPNIGNCEVMRGVPQKTNRYTSIDIEIIAPQERVKLIERIYPSNDKELYNYRLVSNYTLAVPQIFFADADKGFLLMADLSEKFIQGNHFDEDNDYGAYLRKNHKALLRAVAKYHASFWEKHDIFEQVGLDWRLESRENLLSHILGMEKDFRKYRTAEEKGEIPKAWNIFENKIESGKLDYLQKAIDILREKYIDLLDTRFSAGKNITVIHGDLHPGNMFISKTTNDVKFIDMEAVRMGLCTEDLAMLLALHIAPDKEHALPLLKHYHACLCETVNNYPFEQLLSDYQISIMENMFFAVRLLNRGIYDFSMRDRAIQAFEAFVLDME